MPPGELVALKPVPQTTQSAEVQEVCSILKGENQDGMKIRYSALLLSSRRNIPMIPMPLAWTLLTTRVAARTRLQGMIQNMLQL